MWASTVIDSSPLLVISSPFGRLCMMNLKCSMEMVDSWVRINCTTTKPFEYLTITLRDFPTLSAKALKQNGMKPSSSSSSLSLAWLRMLARAAPGLVTCVAIRQRNSVNSISPVPSSSNLLIKNKSLSSIFFISNKSLSLVLYHYFLEAERPSKIYLSVMKNIFRV